MLTLLRFLQILALTIWVGGLIFFAFVLAPTAFHLVPTHEAGLVVGGSLKSFDRIAFVCGAVFLCSAAVLSRQTPSSPDRSHRVMVGIVFVMLLATAYLAGNIIPAMDGDQRLAGGDINILQVSDPVRIHFQTLHQRSENVAGGILLLGLCTIFLLSRELVARRETGRLS